MTTDSFVVKPIRFPGGSIGELAVNGTVNDLGVAGARPLALTLVADPRGGTLGRRPARRGRGDRRAPREAAGVEVVAGDTKVVERGHADGMYIMHDRASAGATRARRFARRAARRATGSCCPGAIGEHGTAIMLARGEFELDADIESDTRVAVAGGRRAARRRRAGVRCLRDATRGGVASVLNELARASGVAMLVREADVPVEPAVAGASELLGIDPMYVANEGKLVAFVAPEHADAALAALRAAPAASGGRDRRGAHRAARHGAGRDRASAASG